MSDVSPPPEGEAPEADKRAEYGPATVSLPEPTNTGDARVDEIVAVFVRLSAQSDDLAVRIEAATTAHRQLQARLTADR